MKIYDESTTHVNLNFNVTPQNHIPLAHTKRHLMMK